MDELVNRCSTIIVMVIGNEISKTSKKYFLNFILFIRLKFLQKQVKT